MGFAKDLRASVLQAAMQGKLTEQLETDTPVSALLADIKAEKDRLISEKKIKKEKPLSAISDDDISFDIPESWTWVNLGDISYTNGGFAFKSSDYSNVGVRVIRISDFSNIGISNKQVVRHPYNESLAQYKIKENDILMCMTGGTVGKCCIVKCVDEEMVTNQRVANITSVKVLPKFLYSILSGPIIQEIINRNKNSTNDNISMDLITTFPIPIPPIEEQERIVQRIEEIKRSFP